MKKREVRKWRQSVCLAVFAALVFFFSESSMAYAARNNDVSGGKTAGEEREAGTKLPEKSLLKRIPLNAETVTQIPKYIAEGEILYVLDETAITIEVTGYGSSEGADVVTTKRTVKDLSDNDLARIEKNINHGGISCKLLCVSYTVTGWDERGVPDRYTAVCEYGGLKKYSNSYAAEWTAAVRYDAYERKKLPEKEDIVYEYQYSDFWKEAAPGMPEEEGLKNQEDVEEEKIPDEPENKLMVRKTPYQDEKGAIWKYLFLPAGIILLLGALCAMLYVLYAILADSVFLFSMTRKGKYRYIGHIRLKEMDGNGLVSLTERMLAKAEILSFKMKIPEKVLRKIGTGMIMVQCPDGKAAVMILDREVSFDLERA